MLTQFHLGWKVFLNKGLWATNSFTVSKSVRLKTLDLMGFEFPLNCQTLQNKK